MTIFHAELFILMEFLPDIQVTLSQKTACAVSTLEGWLFLRGWGQLSFSPWLEDRLSRYNFVLSILPGSALWALPSAYNLASELALSKESSSMAYYLLEAHRPSHLPTFSFLFTI